MSARLPKFDRKRRASGRKETILHFPARVMIFDEQHPSRQLYQLRAGRIQVSCGRGVILDYLRAGDFFGEECFLPPNRRCLSAKSVTPTRIARLRLPQVLDRLRRDPSFARRFLSSLAGRLDWRTQMIRDFVREPAERRLAALLYRLTPGKTATGWVALHFSPSNSEMARTIGTTRARISYFMGRFQRMGWLQRRPKLRIRREGLREFLQARASQDHRVGGCSLSRTGVDKV